MDAALKLSRAIDLLNTFFARIADWLVLLASLICAVNAMRRYALSESSNAWLEIQWYMFAGMVLLGAAYTLKTNNHVRVDIIYSIVTPRNRLWIDLFGLVFFLMPAMLTLAWMSWPYFVQSWQAGEISANASGLIRWPVKLLLPVGFGLVALQGASEIIKRIAALNGRYVVETKYEKPLQ